MIKTQRICRFLLKFPKFYNHQSFFAKDLKVYKKAIPTPIDSEHTNFQFGEAISDHIGEILYNQEDGWSAP